MLQNQLFPATLMPDRDWWHALWPDPDKVIRELQIAPGMAVIDLGCGDGYFTTAIARRIGSARVTGLDLDPAMLEQAKAFCTNLSNCDWLAGDAMQLRQLITEPVDYVLIANTFHGVPDKTGLAAEVAAVLRPAGCFAIVNWHPMAREATPVLGQARGPRSELRMSVTQTQSLVEPAGFELAALVELPPYHYGTIFRKAARQG